MSFVAQIKGFNSQTEKATKLVVQGTALALFAKVVLRTPVLTGRARANWLASLGRPGSSVLSATDKAGTGVIAKAAAKVKRSKLGQSIFFVNNLGYIKDLEDGTSKKSPEGMVKVTVAEFQQEVRKQVKKV